MQLSRLNIINQTASGHAGSQKVPDEKPATEEKPPRGMHEQGDWYWDQMHRDDYYDGLYQDGYDPRD